MTTNAAVRSVVTVVLVCGAVAAVLSAADAMATLVIGLPRGVHACASLDAAGRALGARVVLPAFFPPRLSWPPAAITATALPTASIAVTFAARADAAPALIVAQTAEGAALVPGKLLAPGAVLQEAAVTVGEQPGVIRRVQAGDGRVWLELAWRRADRAFAVRSLGAEDELLRVARSMR
jgi:hypothetical protein